MVTRSEQKEQLANLHFLLYCADRKAHSEEALMIETILRAKSEEFKFSRAEQEEILCIKDELIKKSLEDKITSPKDGPKCLDPPRPPEDPPASPRKPSSHEFAEHRHSPS